MATVEPVEDYQGGANLAQVTGGVGGTTSFDLINNGPSGLFVHSSERALVGLVRSAKINAATTGIYGQWSSPSHNNHYRRHYFYFAAAPSATVPILTLRNGADSAVACQVRATSAGKLDIRNGTTLVGTPQDLPIGEIFALQLEYVGAGDQTVRCFKGADLGSIDSADQTWAMTGALTATNFSKSGVGSVAGIGGVGLTFYVLWSSILSDSAVPAAYVEPAAPSVDGNMQIVRLEEDGTYTTYELVKFVSTGVTTDYAIDRFNGPTSGGSWSDNLVPSQGAIFGSSIPNGKNTTEAAIGAKLQALRIYKSGAWTTGVTSGERLAAEPPGEPRKLLVYSWKPPGGNWGAAVASPAVLDAAIDAMCAAMRSYGHKFFLFLFHEPDDNVPATGTAAEFKAWFRHCYTRIKPRLPNAVICPCFMGYRSHESKWADMWPGEAYVDGWVFYDPYGNTDDANLSEILNDPDGGATGFYNFARANWPTVEIGIGETGTNREPGQFSDSAAAAHIDGWAASYEANFPHAKMVLWWDQDLAGGIETKLEGTGRSLMAAAVGRLARSAYFNKVSANDAP